MIEFMVIGLPRSGTTWAANWLTTDRTFCVHDPLWTTHYSRLDQVVPLRAGERVAGISCSGSWMWLDWLNNHPARKLILHRPLGEIRESLQRCGVPEAAPDDEAPGLLDRVHGRHYHWRCLFDPFDATNIWQYLTGLPFDAERHTELVQIAVQPRFDALRKDNAVQQRLARELNSTLG
jgi:hypothetical protein